MAWRMRAYCSSTSSIVRVLRTSLSLISWAEATARTAAFSLGVTATPTTRVRVSCAWGSFVIMLNIRFKRVAARKMCAT